MGQAKLRGDFETRKKEGIERRERERLARIAELEARLKDRSERRAALIAGIAGLLAGTTPR